MRLIGSAQTEGSTSQWSRSQRGTPGPKLVMFVTGFALALDASVHKFYHIYLFLKNPQIIRFASKRQVFSGAVTLGHYNATPGDAGS